MLEDIIKQYIKLGFTKVGITEHIPPVSDKFLYPDEIEDKLSALRRKVANNRIVTDEKTA